MEKLANPFKRIFRLKEEIIQFTPIEKIIELVKRQKWIEVFKRGLKHNTNIVLNLYHGNVSASEIEKPFDVFLFRLKEDDKLKTNISLIFPDTHGKIFKILGVYTKWKDAGLHSRAFCFENNITKEEFFNAYTKAQAENIYNNINVTNYIQDIISRIKQKYDEIDKNEYIGRNVHNCVKDIVANKINIDQIKFILTENTKEFMKMIASTEQKYLSEEDMIMATLYKQNKIIFLEDNQTWIKI